MNERMDELRLMVRIVEENDGKTASFYFSGLYPVGQQTEIVKAYVDSKKTDSFQQLIEKHVCNSNPDAKVEIVNEPNHFMISVDKRRS